MLSGTNRQLRGKQFCTDDYGANNVVHTITGPEVVSDGKQSPPLPCFLCDESFFKAGR
jgi:hypothetical protein